MKVFLAVGCLWQRQDPDLRQRVLRGLGVAARIRRDNGIDSAVITMNVVSLMDKTVLKKGSYSFTNNRKNRTPRVDYGDAHAMLDPYVERDGNILLPLARHTLRCARSE